MDFSKFLKKYANDEKPKRIRPYQTKDKNLELIESGNWALGMGKLLLSNIHNTVRAFTRTTGTDPNHSISSWQIPIYQQYPLVKNEINEFALLGRKDNAYKRKLELTKIINQKFIDASQENPVVALIRTKFFPLVKDAQLILSKIKLLDMDPYSTIKRKNEYENQIRELYFLIVNFNDKVKKDFIPGDYDFKYLGEQLENNFSLILRNNNPVRENYDNVDFYELKNDLYELKNNSYDFEKELNKKFNQIEEELKASKRDKLEKEYREILLRTKYTVVDSEEYKKDGIRAKEIEEKLKNL